MGLKDIRWVALALGVSNFVVIIVGGFLLHLAFPVCGHRGIVPFAFVLVVAGVRIATTLRIGIAQKLTAMAIIGSSTSPSPQPETTVSASALRHERRMRYKSWLWWTRFAMVITVLQFGGASYLIFNLAKRISNDGSSDNCVLGLVLNGNWWERKLLISFMILVCSVALVQCFIGSDVLRWRSFYATEDSAWKSHYREIFDHGIREALCCLGRAKYLSALEEEDEVYSVARLLGDLVAYHATGTGHLEFLAGLALLRRRDQSPVSYEGLLEASEEQLREAAALHQFAEAAYTGPLLDVGRHLILFPCAWLYRQGILTCWTRNRRPMLEGDNWWRGHAAAFLKYVNLSSEVLRRGRVRQGNCEAAYFIVVLHHLRSVVISVRGTETLEDLLTDGLCRECSLSDKDLDGLINSTCILPDIRQSVVSSFPHYGHSGIVEAARDLYMQIEGNPVGHGVESSSESGGFLSSLLGVGCECEGYNARIVGHSLGGAIAALLGISLHARYPNLHVYTYGPLPCVDSVIARACSDFVTSIVYNNEFSSRLSVGSIMRLRAAAIKALSEDNTQTDSSAMSFRLARRLLLASKFQGLWMKDKDPASDQEFHVWNSNEVDREDTLCELTDHFHEDVEPVSQLMEAVPSFENGSAGDPFVELFLPGRVIHIVPQEKSFHMHLWKGWSISEGTENYKAYLANRESFKDIIVSPSMFLDHFPWRCHYAMQKVLATHTAQCSLDDVPQSV